MQPNWQARKIKAEAEISLDKTFKHFNHARKLRCELCIEILN